VGDRTRQLEAVVVRRTDTRGERFAMTIDGTRHVKRSDAGEHLHRLLEHHLRATPPANETSATIGTLAGLNLQGAVDRRAGDEVRLSLPEAGIDLHFSGQDWHTLDPATLVQRLERRIQNLDAALADARHDHEAANQEANRARARIGAPFEHDHELHRLQRRQREINEQLLAPADAPTIEPSAAERMAARLAALRPAAQTPPSLAR